MKSFKASGALAETWLMLNESISFKSGISPSVMTIGAKWGSVVLWSKFFLTQLLWIVFCLTRNQANTTSPPFLFGLSGYSLETLNVFTGKFDGAHISFPLLALDLLALLSTLPLSVTVNSKSPKHPYYCLILYFPVFYVISLTKKKLQSAVLSVSQQHNWWSQLNFPTSELLFCPTV